MFLLNCPASPIVLRENYGFSRHEIADIVPVLAARLELLCNEWKRIHGIA